MIAIGIDIGGTTIKGAAVDSTGKLFPIFSLSISNTEDPDTVMSRLADVVKKYLQEQKLERRIVGIGMGVPGCIDSINGVVSSSPNLPLWTNYPIKSVVEKLTSYKVRITNDANAAALGEHTFGCCKDVEAAVLITLGTGVGTGIIIDRKLFEGNESKGAEIGHTSLILGGRPCNCGRNGCFEAYASATGLIQDTKEAMQKHPESKMNDIAVQFGVVNAKVAFKAAREYEDPWAQKVVDQYISYLSEGCLNICNTFRPNVIVLSGGIANEGEYLTSRVQTYMKERFYGFKGSPEVKVIQGTLGYDSGKIGAAALFFKKEN